MCAGDMPPRSERTALLPLNRSRCPFRPERYQPVGSIDCGFSISKPLFSARSKNEDEDDNKNYSSSPIVRDFS